MIVENGKRYLRADGEITGVIETTPSYMYPHHDPMHRQIYYSDGRAAGGSQESGTTLVSEYVEPCIECGNGARIMPCPVCSDKPEPQPHEYGPWIPWAGGECPVADGVMGQVQFDDEARVEVEAKPASIILHYTWSANDIIYYRVLIEEPKAVESVRYVDIKGELWRDKTTAGVQGRKAIITAQGDNIKAEWAPKEDKE